MSSRIGTTFWPKPPPVSRMMTRTPCAGMPSSRARERAQFVRCLGGRPHRQFLRRRLPLDDHAARLHRHRRIDLLVDVRFCDMGGGRERLLVRRRASHSAGDVVGVRLVDDDVGIGAADRLSEVGDGGQRLVVDVDQLDGILGEVAALGDDEGNRVADELHLALGQRRARGVRDVLTRDGVPRLLDVRIEVAGGEHGVHTGQGEGRGGVDAVDLRPGKRAAHEAGVQHAGPVMSSTKVPRPVSRRLSSTRGTRVPAYRVATVSVTQSLPHTTEE